MSNLPKTLVAGLACLGLAAACFLAKALIGSQVDADGVLREPFALIPIGWLLAFVAVPLLVIGLYLSRRGSKGLKG